MVQSCPEFWNNEPKKFDCWYNSAETFDEAYVGTLRETQTNRIPY